MITYPEIKVRLTGTDGNAFAILAKVSKALSRANVPKAEIDAFMKQATSGDYQNLLQTCCKTVRVS